MEEPPVRKAEPRHQLPRTLAILAACVTMLGVGIAATYYYFIYSETVAKDRRDEQLRGGRARIYFTLHITKEWCKAEKDGSFSNCSADVVPTDPAKKLLNFAVQLPVNIDPRNEMRGSFGAGNLQFGPFNKAISARTFDAFGERPAGLTQALLPVVIYSTYEFEGLQYQDRSLYYVLYETYGNRQRAFSAPVGMSYCGRLDEGDETVDFVVDPFAKTLAGNKTDATTGVAFNCPAKSAMWLSLPRGQVYVETDLSPGQVHAPRPGAKSIAISFSDFRMTPLNPPMRISYQARDLDDPSLPQVPKVR